MAEDTSPVFRATHRFARMSAQKARLVMDLIRGVPVEKALTTLRFSQRRASPMIGKVLRSALANAAQKAGLEGEDLVVWRAFVDGGPIVKRWRPRAMGRGYPRLRRTCHLSVVLKQVPRKEAKPKGKTGARGAHDPARTPRTAPARASHDPARASHDPARASHDPARASHDPAPAAPGPQAPAPEGT